MSVRTKAWSALKVGAAAASTVALGVGLRRWEERTANAELGKGKRFVILGGGFAGVAVAQTLARLLPGEDNGEIVLIDSNNYLLFTPMLTEAAGGELETRSIISSVRSMGPRVQFVQGEVTKISLPDRTVELNTSGGELAPEVQTYSGVHLVIALGSVVNYHDTPGVAEHSIPMKRLEDATRVFERASACLERATIEKDPAKRKELLTFVVAGGGYTGVETMAALNDLVRTTAEKLPELNPAEIRTVIVHPGDRLLPEITSSLAAYAAKQLSERGIEILYHSSIDAAGENFVGVKDGERIPARTLIWAAGVTPNPLLKDLPATKGKHHGLSVNVCCQVPSHEGVWALGDCAEIPTGKGDALYGPTAQNAMQEGKLVAGNIVRSLRGESLKAFKYEPIGELALVGRHTGVAQVYGTNFSGPLAWAMWRAIYLAKMPGMAQKGRILSEWVLDALFGRAPAPISTGRGRTGRA